MNIISQIQKESPKAFKEFHKWCIENQRGLVLSFECSFDYLWGVMFRYLDERGYLISVKPVRLLAIWWGCSYMNKNNVHPNGALPVESPKYKPTRQEALEEIFVMIFSVMEEVINKNEQSA